MDLVTKESVLYAIDSWIESGEYNYTNATRYLRERINSLPTIQIEERDDSQVLRAMQESADAVKASPRYDFSCVTPLLEDSVSKKGKWNNKFKRDSSSIFGATLIGVCSSCNKENPIGWTYYCPHCGAEMENGEE